MVISEKEVEAMRGEFDRRPWGTYEVLEESDGFKVKKIVVDPGQRLSLQSHKQRREHWIVTKGVALITLGDTEQTIGPDQYIHIPVGTVHRIQNPGTEPLIFVEVQSGNYLGEDDITRYQDDYQRIPK
jgi:mannose-6-phosphate isomerase-like protein (cupin superfamily)